MDTVYKPQIDNRPAVEDQVSYFPQGPGDGLSYSGWLLYPETRFANREITEKVCHLMNIAYREGEKKAKLEMRKALGL